MIKKLSVYRLQVTVALFLAVGYLLLATPTLAQVGCDTSYYDNTLHVCYVDGIGWPDNWDWTMAEANDVTGIPSPVGSRDPVMEKNFAEGEIDGTGKWDEVSAIWRGRINFQAGNYTFYVRSDDGVTLDIDGYGRPIDKWFDQGATTYSYTINNLPAGYRNITLRWYEAYSSAYIKLWWTYTAADVSPTGSFTSGSCTNFTGTASDSNSPSTPIKIDFHLVRTDPNNTDLSQNYYLGQATTSGGTFTFNPQSITEPNFFTKKRDVRAYALNVDSSGNSSSGAPAADLGYKTVTCIPPPSSLSASCPNPGTTATLSWTNATGATRYALRVNNTADSWTGSCSTSAPNDFCNDNVNSPYSFTSTSGANYGWWLHSCNATDCNFDQSASGPNFTCTAPTTPTSLTATPSCSSGAGSATLTWSGTNSTLVADISTDNFVTYYNRGVNNATSTSAPSGFNGAQGVSGALTLTPGTTYQWRLWNGVNHSATASFTVPNCVPSNLRVDTLPSCSNSAYTATLRWDNTNPTLYADISPNTSTFTSGSYYNRNVGSQIYTDTNNFTPYGFSGSNLTLNPGTNYYWRLWNGSAAYNASSPIYVPYCSQPTTLTASCPSPGTTANLDWSDATSATYYLLRVNNTADGWDSSCSSAGGDFCRDNVTSSAYTFTGSTPGATYSWWVHACNTSGCNTTSSASGPSFTCTPPPTPTNLRNDTITCSTGRTTTLRWDGTNTPLVADISGINDSGFSSYYNKGVDGAASTSAPSGFNGAYNASGALSLSPGTYYWRLWNGNNHSNIASFTVPTCAAPTATISGPTTATTGQQTSTYSATATGTNLSKVEIYRAQSGCTASSCWTLVNSNTSCNGASSCTVTGTWTAQSGNWDVVVNAFDNNGGQCTGNPAGSSGFSDCGSSDKVTTRVLPSSCSTYYADKTYVCFFDGTDPNSSPYLWETSDNAISSPPCTTNCTYIAFEHEWGEGAVWNTGRSDNVSGKWRGKINFKAGTYTFHVFTDDGVQLYLGSNTLIDQWRGQRTQWDSTSIVMNDGQQDITLNWNEYGAEATIKLWWDYVPNAPANPTGLNASCGAPGTTATLNWTPSSGATSYHIRVDKDPTVAPLWDGSCSGSAPNDFCLNYYGNGNTSSYSFTSSSGATYDWWIHACNGTPCSSGVHMSPSPYLTCYQDVAPTGTFDSASCSSFSGSNVYDSNSPSTSLQVDFHLVRTDPNNIGDLTQNYYLGTTWTNASTKTFSFDPTTGIKETTEAGGWSTPGAKAAFYGKTRDVRAYVKNVDGTGAQNAAVGATDLGYKTASCYAQASFTGSPPTTGTTRQTLTYNASLTGGSQTGDILVAFKNDDNTTTLQVPGCPVKSDNVPTLGYQTKNSQNQWWCWIGQERNADLGGSFSGSFTPTTGGNYWVAINGYAYDAGTAAYNTSLTCSGNPTSSSNSGSGGTLDFGVKDCGSNDYKLLTVTATLPTPSPSPSPTPSPGPATSCGTAATYRAQGLVSTPTAPYDLKFPVDPSTGRCTIKEEVAFRTFPTYGSLKSLYYEQSKATKVPTSSISSVANNTIYHLTTGDVRTENNFSLGTLNYGSAVSIIFVDRALDITGNISGSGGLVIIVNGDVNIASTVTQIDAVIMSQGTIFTAGADCNTSTVFASALTINGSLISLSEPIRFCRTLTDNSQPAEKIIQQPKYLVILKDLMSDTIQGWAEIP